MQDLIVYPDLLLQLFVRLEQFRVLELHQQQIVHHVLQVHTVVEGLKLLVMPELIQMLDRVFALHVQLDSTVFQDRALQLLVPMERHQSYLLSRLQLALHVQLEVFANLESQLLVQLERIQQLVPLFVLHVLQDHSVLLV